MIETTGTFPGYKASPAFALVQENEKLEAFYEVLRTTRHQRPVMPAQAHFMGALDRAVSYALNGSKSPQEALLDAQHETQRELDRVMARWQAHHRQ